MAILHRLKTMFASCPTGAPENPRILGYCASNIGLGHYGRLVRVLSEVRRRRPEVSILVATDARDTSLAVEAGLASLTLPGYEFIDNGDFRQRPANLKISNSDLHAIRSRTLSELADTYRPDLLFLDTLPHGKRDEALPLLRRLRQMGRTRVALMMRDIPCPPGESFKLSGDRAAVLKHAAYYDCLLIAGDRRCFDAAEAYNWPPELTGRLHYVGYAIPQLMPMGRAEVFSAHPKLDPSVPTIVASLGGGWAAPELVPLLLDGLTEIRGRGRSVQMILMTGPAVDRVCFDQTRERVRTMDGIVLERFSPHFANILPHADMAILLAGSTLFQVLESDIPLLTICRDYSSREQDLRAERLAHLPGVRVLKSDRLKLENIVDGMIWGLDHPPAGRQTGFDFNGVANAANVLLDLL